ncbi:hypothetical protein JR316_0011868 [Psilocybe cubensis]|uniref:Uncharacterized protein n=2 Tax=Psilocybe cubensis TaxID=181762 RepID=A0ACB8GLE7_PSICU|nr:hypothetical protein JR316_0011868 [Psilocybe cubensis]KAH9476294.1 hypothetical protein JR316_0011868 [Psilocybe cubensis]
MTLPEFKIVFPPPPPTTNELTAHQRTQLVRKTRKIEQLLGTTPRLLDTSTRPGSPIHVSFPHSLPQRRLTKTRRSSIDSTSSASSSGSGCVNRSSSLRVSRSNSNLRPINGFKHLSSEASIAELFSAYEYDNTAPLLRLAMESMSLDTIPASPDPTRESFAVSEERPASTVFTTDDASSSPRNSLVLEPPPSANSLRKQKMDRLRKKLGSDVPFDLVFPNSRESSSENTPPRTRDKACPPLPAPSPRPAKRRIASSRDSISESVTIHRAARRQPARPHSPSTSVRDNREPLTSTRHKKTRSEPQAPPSLPPLNFKRNLSFIIESPEEHGAGCTEEFGISHTSSKSEKTDVKAGWVVQAYNADDAEFKLWSTRKGYEGWNEKKANLAPISTIYFPSSNDNDSSPSSASSSPRSSTTPDAELKRRSSSYRKPAPTIPIELF